VTQSEALLIPPKPKAQAAPMKALVYHGPGRRSWEDKPRPVIREATDAVVRVTTATICGTDLHILKGDVPTVADGRILGHEGVGVVEETGSAVAGFERGDLVLISCITSCGKCDFCKKGMYSHCRSGGWNLGHTIDGTQAEYVRIPHADTSLYRVSPDLDPEAVVLLSDVLPTAYECGVLNGAITPGDTVAIVGAGPIGLAAVVTARLYSPAHIVVIDKAESRLQAAKLFGADITVLAGTEDPLAAVRALTGGLGADVVIEAVGTPQTFELCATLVRAGGHLANVGVHGKPATLHLEDLWIRNVTITTGLVDTYSTPKLLDMLVAGQLDLGHMVTHRFGVEDFMQAYDVFADPARTGALKVVLSR